MRVTNLKLFNFRNYTNIDVNFEKGINLIYGLNASGKTNLVEAISLLSIGKSFRTNNEFSLIKKEEEFARVESVFFRKKENCLKLILSKEGKNVEHNDIKLNRLSELTGLLITLTFIPSDVSMFKESPSVRRKFLDINLSSLYRGYIKALSEYRNFLKQRNALLKEEFVDITYLEVIEESSYQCQHLISSYRYKLIKQLEEKINLVFKELDSNQNDLKIKYISNFTPNKTFEEFKEEAKRKYLKERETDLRKKSTTIGVHHDDFEIYLNDLEVGLYASQGQNRLVSLSLKLALARLIKELIKEDPVIILDDVLSELDEVHQTRLIEELRSYEQVFITSAKDENIKNISKYNVTTNLVTRR